MEIYSYQTENIHNCPNRLVIKFWNTDKAKNFDQLRCLLKAKGLCSAWGRGLKQECSKCILKFLSIIQYIHTTQ